MLNLLIGGAVAVGTYFFIDETVKDATGRRIHEHLFDWWCELRDYIGAWLHANPQLGIRRIGLAVLDAFDDFAVRTKRTADMLTLCALAADNDENAYEVATFEVSAEEALAQFPDLQQTPVLIQELES